MATIKREKNADGSTVYRVRAVVGYRANGDPIQRMETHRTMKAAQMAGRRMETARDRGQAVQPSRLRLSEFIAQFMERASRRGVRPTTLYNYQRLVDKRLLPDLGGMRLCDLSRANVQAWIDGIAAPSVARLSYRLLHAVLAEAIDLELLPVNPCERIRLPAAGQSGTSWSRDQARRFLATAANHMHQPYWLLAVRLGLRPSELLGLRWQSVDLEAGTLAVVEARPIVATRRFAGRPKSPSGVRLLDLPADLIAALRSHKLRQSALRLRQGAAWQDLVVTNHLGAEINYRALWQAFRRLCRRADVPVIRLYDMRHTAISLMAEAGADFKAISEVAGHSDPRLTRRVYQHVNREQRRAALQALGDALEEPIEPVHNDAKSG